ncbi:MAG: DNA polymerase III subunit gamma/tau [Acidobacteria bacterium]|nr:DNA polymerase III subunit gamma/tau [Acidobacteriota bacterium]
MYQVLARTWRPRRFSEVVGQRHVTQTLENAIRLGRIGHGYIFSGQRGVGKTTVARLLAKSLNCRKGPIPEACGECDSCQEIAAGRALDVIEIDAASNRGIDAMRELRENARYAAARDRYKVFIIDEAHQITPEGFNALLKTLEEPPPHVIFILATTEVHQFPDTILSRCQHFNFHAIAFSEILAHLEAVCAGEKIQAQPEALVALARSGEGSIRDSLSRLEQAIAAFGSNLEGPAVARLLGAAPSELLEEVFHAVLAQKRERLLDVVEKLVEEGYQLAHFCSQLVLAARNLLVVRVAGAQPRLLESTAEESERLAAMAQNFTEENLIRFLEILLGLNQELRQSTQPRFHMELGLLKLVDAERLVAIEDLLAQMENKPGTPVDADAAARPKTAAVSREVPREFPGHGAAQRTPDPAHNQAARSEGSERLSPFERDIRRKKQTPGPSAHAEISPGEIPEKGPSVSATPGGEHPVPVAQGSVAVATAAKLAPIPAADTALSAQEETWTEEILRRLEEQSKPALASLLSRASGWKWGGEEVRIELTDNGLLKLLTEQDQQLLNQLATAVLGRQVRVKLLQGDRRAAEQAATNLADAVEQRARRDPGVVEFEKIFGKQVTRIRGRKE